MIGLYIDADNISHKIVPELLTRLNLLGNLGIMKVYRDWSQIDSKKWIEVTNQYKFEAIQCFRQPKKQSTDIYMITDMCNDLYTCANLEYIILATCDSDFTHLCHQILRLGKKLILVGKDNKLGSICHKFWYYNDLLKPAKTQLEFENIETKIIQNKHDIYELSSDSESDNYLSTVSEDEKPKAKKQKSEKDKLLNTSLDKLNTSLDELKKYLIEGMKENYILLISEFKKNLKEIKTYNIETNWRKMETEIKKFPFDFLVVKRKSKINILYIPELLNKKFNENQLGNIIKNTYPDILNQIPLEYLTKMLISI